MEELRDKFQLNDLLEMIDLERNTHWYCVNKKCSYEEKHREVLEHIEDIILEHPGYGYRRIKVALEEEYGKTVNHKVIRKLLRRNNLGMKRSVRKNGKSGYRKGIHEAEGEMNLLAEKQDIDPFEVLYTDFTELRYDGGARKAQLIPILGHASKMLFGWATGKRANADLAIRAWDRASDCLDQLGVDLNNTIMHHDQDAVFTGNRWVDRMLCDEGMRLSYSENGAKGNTVMESFHGHFKCEAKSLFVETETIEELQKSVSEQMKYWNQSRRHSSINYRSPADFIDEYWKGG